MVKKLKTITFIFMAFLICGVMNVNAEGMSTEFAAVFPNGKYIMPSIAPTSEHEANFLLTEYISMKHSNFRVDLESCNENYTQCDVCYNCSPMEDDGEIHSVGFEYSYNEAIKAKIDGYVENIPADKTDFMVKDLELINYWLNLTGNMINFSGELKSYIDNKNFYNDFRLGDGGEFRTYFGGIAKFEYKGTMYHIRDMGVLANHVIYVPDNTESTKEALMAAAQARIDEYAGSGKITLAYVDTIANWLENYDPEYKEWMDQSYEDGENSFLKEAEGDFYYEATIGNVTRYLIIVKDTQRMISPKYITSDVSSDISISANNGIIPLDTLIRADRVTEGEAFNEIMEKLNALDSEMFDLKLYANSLEDYFTRLDDGTFEVRIPISEKFRDKDLIVYYIDDDGETIEYEVKVEDGFAVFNTNHFSIYTLAEKQGVSEKNPQTYDGIVNYIILGSISAIGVAGCAIYLKKKSS